jgi:glycosyltransferase involved in cell wall biosynthesis
MKVTFFSNFLNHHQLTFCQAMYDRLGDGFRFVATTPTADEQLELGFSDLNKHFPFVITTYDSKNNKKKAEELALESEVIITGGSPEILLFDKERRRQNKLTFRYMERINKKGRWTLLLPPRLYQVIKRYVVCGNDNLYILCAGAYVAGDFALLNAYKGKTYKWGYFPEIKKYDINKLFIKKANDEINILWVGRFIRLKHPEKVIDVAMKLKKDNYKFNIMMIGKGPEEDRIKKLAHKNNLYDCIEFHGSMPFEKVRDYMEHANILLFTSNYGEGWGAVLSEAMGGGCAVVASHAAGATPFLIKNNQNGLVYRNESNKDLYKQVKTLMDSKELREKLGRAAYLTMSEKWNAGYAAEKFIGLCEKKMQDSAYSGETGDGPCSIAFPVSQGKIYSTMM